MNGQPVPKEDIPIPAEIMDGWLRGLSKAEIWAIINSWRSRGLSKAEIVRAMSIRNDTSTLWGDDDPISSVVLPVLDLQRQVGKELVDWTWAEALEAFIEARRRDLDEVIELGRKFGKVDPDTEMSIRQMLRALVADNGAPVTTADLDFELAKRRILKVLRRAREIHDQWLEVRESGLGGEILTSYLAKVSGYYWGDEEYKREETTERARQEAKKLKSRKLDSDPYVIELRRGLGIPDEAFHDVDEAACWLYDRYPAIKGLAPYGPEGGAQLHGEGPRDLYDPAIMQVSVLAEATRRLRQKHKLDSEWDFLLCFYLLRGKLEPLPRKMVNRKRPKRKKHEEIWELWKKYQHAFKVVISYNCGLTDADWAEIYQKEPVARLDRIGRDAKDRIVAQAYEIAERKGTVRPLRKEIKEASVWKVCSRMRPEGKT